MRRSRSGLLLSSAVVVAILAGCQLVGAVTGPRGGAYPAACAQWEYSARRCGVIVDRAMQRAKIDESAVIAIDLLPFDQQAELGGHQVARVAFHVEGGATVEQDVWCIGVDDSFLCREDAPLHLWNGVNQDVPCTGEPPAGCATLPPEPDASTIFGSTPLRVAALDVPLDRLGAYDIDLGKASLPNGYLTERAFDVVDHSPENYWMDGGILLDVRPDIESRPELGSIYRDPFPGPEPVSVHLVFTVTELTTPSVLQIRDVVVR
jgi:hypothetical protein